MAILVRETELPQPSASPSCPAHSVQRILKKESPRAFDLNLQISARVIKVSKWSF